MFTPQQIQEQTFARAVFGGYDMAQVDAFLEPLTDDYIELYKENAVLKSKMKFLVEKLEELRAGQTAAASANPTAETQAECDRMLAETRKKCEEMLAGAKQQAAESAEVTEEQARLNYAKQTALNFIEVIENDVKAHLELLESLKSRDLSVELEEKKPAREKPYDWAAHDPAPASDSKTEAIADEISENVGKIVGTDEGEQTPPAAPAHHVDSPTIQFPELQFGKNYDPKKDSDK